jgi:hypothetical protein
MRSSYAIFQGEVITEGFGKLDLIDLYPAIEKPMKLRCISYFRITSSPL